MCEACACAALSLDRVSIDTRCPTEAELQTREVKYKIWFIIERIFRAACVRLGACARWGGRAHRLSVHVDERQLL